MKCYYVIQNRGGGQLEYICRDFRLGQAATTRSITEAALFRDDQAAMAWMQEICLSITDWQISLVVEDPPPELDYLFG